MSIKASDWQHENQPVWGKGSMCYQILLATPKLFVKEVANTKSEVIFMSKRLFANIQKFEFLHCFLEIIRRSQDFIESLFP